MEPQPPASPARAEAGEVGREGEKVRDKNSVCASRPPCPWSKPPSPGVEGWEWELDPGVGGRLRERGRKAAVVGH